MQDDQHSFLIFLFSFITTIVSLSFFQNQYFLIGTIGIFWSLYGFFRLFYLNRQNASSLPKLTRLPAKILFGLYQEQEKYNQKIKNRFISIDIILWLIISIGLLGWVTFNSFSSVTLEELYNFQLSQSKAIGLDLTKYLNFHVIMRDLTFFSFAGIIILCMISFSLNHKNMKIGVIVLLSIISAYIILTFNDFSPAFPLRYVSLSHMMGDGWGQDDIADTILNDMMQQSGTSLIRRGIEGGIIFAYGFYALLIIPFYIFIKNLFKSQNHKIYALIGLVLIFMLILQDIMLINTANLTAISLLQSGLIALICGHFGFTTPHKNP